MNNLSTIMMIALITGAVTIVASTIGLVIDHRRNVAKMRERRRQDPSRNTVRTIMGNSSSYMYNTENYRRRA